MREKLTIEKLAHIAEMHPTYLSGIERGIRNPTWDYVTKLLDALKITLVELARYTESTARTQERVNFIVEDEKRRTGLDF